MGDLFREGQWFERGRRSPTLRRRHGEVLPFVSMSEGGMMSAHTAEAETDQSGTAAFLSEALGWGFAADVEGWRQATKVSIGDHRIGSVSDLSNPIYPPDLPAVQHVAS
ncbi:hypothetical protein [Streptomyces clavifer]|uniref:hypothetical protein n=1 Tax=Streptomyces clavifer TaxID=68188 RepID=UPI003682A384